MTDDEAMKMAHRPGTFPEMINAVFDAGKESGLDDCEDSVECLQEKVKTLSGQLALFRRAAEAALAYDSAIHECANEPEKMASFCTAQGDDLDKLYDTWIRKTRLAYAASEP